MVRVAVVALCVVASTATIDQREGNDGHPGHVIAGRIVDPHRLRPEGAVLMLERQDGRSFSSQPVPLAADDSFVTPPLPPGTYLLEVRRTKWSTAGANVIGLTLVAVASSEISGITVEVRRDSAITGRFRMESDDPKAAWPTHAHVIAFLALDGMPLWRGTQSEGRPAGEFVLHNAFGPRVLRSGYIPAPGSPWWPSRVLLDGRDVTNVPTDFSEHPQGKLEVVFTQHPARIDGTVTDAQGQPVRTPWVTVTGMDRAALQAWSTTSEVVQGGATGRFSVAVLPGRYRVNALPEKAFPSRSAAREGLVRIAFGGVIVEVAERESRTVTVALQER